MTYDPSFYRPVASKFAIGIVLAALVIVAAVYWNEARKEVVFLCGNFTKGVSRSSVIRQLKTGDFLRYQLEEVSTGSRMKVDSMLTFGVYECMIDFDPEDKVVQAGLR